MSRIVDLTGASVRYEFIMLKCLPYLPNEKLIRRRYAMALENAKDKDEEEKLNKEMEVKVNNLKKIKETIANEVQGA